MLLSFMVGLHYGKHRPCFGCYGKVDPACWQQSRPAYGSNAYSNGGWSALDVEEERQRERDFT